MGHAGSPHNTVLGLGRLDHSVGVRTLLTSRYAFQDVNEFGAPKQPYERELDQPVLTRNHNAALNVRREWSGSVVSETRLSVSRLSNTRPETRNAFFRPGVRDSVGGLPAALPPKGGPRNLYSLYQAVSWIRGSHVFKFGGDVIHYRDSIEAPLYQTLWRPTFDIRSFVAGQINGVTVPVEFLTNGRQLRDPVDGRTLSPNRRTHVRYTDVSWFVQDAWKVARRLTLTPGLRWEYFGVQYSPGHEKVRDVNFYLGSGATYYERFALRTVDAPGDYRNHITRPDRNNFGPRFGLVFDLRGNGTTVFRAGGGIFFDATFGRIPPAVQSRGAWRRRGVDKNYARWRKRAVANPRRYLQRSQSLQAVDGGGGAILLEPGVRKPRRQRSYGPPRKQPTPDHAGRKEV